MFAFSFQFGYDGLFFLPQANYVTEGTLKDQIIYPDISSPASDEELYKILEVLDIAYLAERWSFNKTAGVHAFVSL